MIRLRKIIASFLFVIFFFPITFQSIHIVWHHSHGYKCDHHLCHQKISDKDFHTDGENISEAEKACLLCEYQFSINDLPGISVFSLVIPVFTCIYSENAKEQQYKQVFSDKTPRAPPASVS